MNGAPDGPIILRHWLSNNGLYDVWTLWNQDAKQAATTDLVFSGAKPSCVVGTGDKKDIGMIRLDFPGYTGEGSLQEICWDDWFEKFDANDLALIYQEETAGGKKSNFNKLVSRQTVEEKLHAHR